MIRHFVSVILPLPLKQLFTYELEEAEYQFLLPGMRVAVPLVNPKCIPHWFIPLKIHLKELTNQKEYSPF